MQKKVRFDSRVRIVEIPVVQDPDHQTDLCCHKHQATTLDRQEQRVSLRGNRFCTDEFGGWKELPTKRHVFLNCSSQERLPSARIPSKFLRLPTSTADRWRPLSTPTFSSSYTTTHHQSLLPPRRTPIGHKDVEPIDDSRRVQKLKTEGMLSYDSASQDITAALLLQSRLKGSASLPSLATKTTAQRQRSNSESPRQADLPPVIPIRKAFTIFYGGENAS